MQELVKSVGAGGDNHAHEVALVQLMLRLIKSGSDKPYLGQPYWNGVSTDTAQAISAFQTAKGLTGEKKTEIAGLVKPGGKTWTALKEALASTGAKYTAMRTWPGVTLAYLAMSSKALEEGVTSVSKLKELHSDFSTKVTEFLRHCHRLTGIAWTVVPQTGGWRSFAGQKGLSSNAGYGESVHAYGYAVDLTARNLSWFDGNGVLHTDAISLTGMTKPQRKEFLDARNAIAKDKGLFGTILEGDLWHLQMYDDFKLDSVSSLMALMQRVGPRKMKWEPKYRTPTEYLCDFGLGGEKYNVGTAVEIWNQSNRIDPKHLAAALLAKKKKDRNFSVDRFLGRAEGKVPPDFKEGDIGEAEVAAMRGLLKAEFEAASANWKSWTPVYYPSDVRREPNPNNKSNKKK